MSDFGGRQLVKNGRWCVPVEERPRGWEFMNVGPMIESAQAPEAEIGPSSIGMTDSDLICADHMIKEAQTLWTKGAQALKDAELVIQRGRSSLEGARAILESLAKLWPEMWERAMEEKAKLQQETGVDA